MQTNPRSALARAAILLLLLLSACSSPPAAAPVDAGDPDVPIVGGITCPSGREAVQGTITASGVYSGTLYYNAASTTMTCPSRVTIAACGAADLSASARAPEHLWRLQPTQTGMVTISTCGSTLADTMLWVGTTPGGTEVVCNDDTAGACPGSTLLSSVRFMATLGTTYYVGVEGVFRSLDGSYRLNVQFGSCPNPNVYSNATLASSCASGCVNGAADPANCGTCGRACGPGQICWVGGCYNATCSPAVTGASGTMLCGNQCANTGWDAHNCGGCGNRCPGGSACINGTCNCPASTSQYPLTACRAGTSVACVNLPSSPANCGACGRGCSTGMVCSAGACAAACAAGTTACTGACANLQTDQYNCGGCGNACPAGQRCEAGQCSDSCTGSPLGNSVGVGLRSGTYNGFGAFNANYQSPNCLGSGLEAVFSWTPPTTGAYRVTVRPATGVPALPNPVVYVRETNCGGTEVACSPGSAATANTNSVIFQAFMGRSYSIFADTDAVLTAAGFVSLDIEAVTPGPAPTCPTRALGGAVGGSVASGTMTLTNSGSAGSCGGEGGNEVTFTWTAPATDTYVISTAGSTFDTIVYVRAGSCPAQATPPSDLQCNDDMIAVHAYGAARRDSQVGLSATAGTTYTIVLDSFNLSAGQYKLNIVPAVGDNRVALNVPMPTTCPEASAALALGTPVTGTTVGAPAGLEGTCGGRQLPERAYAFTAPAAGNYQFAVTAASFDALLYVRRSSCAGTEIACLDDYSTGARLPTVVVALTAGQTVAVVVDGGKDFPAWGTFTLVATATATGTPTPAFVMPPDPCQAAGVPDAPNYLCGTPATTYRQCDRTGLSPSVITVTCAADTLCGASRSPICQPVTPACTSGATMCMGTGATARLQTCLNGVWQASLCPNGCAGTSCAPMGVVGPVTGTVRFEQRVPNSARSDWGPITTDLARNVEIAYIQRNTWVANTRTDNNGRYTFNVPVVADPTDYILLVARANTPANQPLYAVGMMVDARSGNTYSNWNVQANDRVWSWNMGSPSASGDYTLNEASGSGALFIFERMRRAYEYNLLAFPGRPWVPLLAWMASGVSWNCGNCANRVPVTLAGVEYGSQVWINGDESARQYYAESVLMHEFGHSTMAAYGQNPGEGGSHSIGVTAAQGLTWSEGFGTFYGQSILDSPVYIDHPRGFMWTDNVATRMHSGNRPYLRPNPTLSPIQDIDECEVTAILWRLRAQLTTPEERYSLLQTLADRRINNPTWTPTRGNVSARNSYRCYNRHRWTTDSNGARQGFCYVRDQNVTTLPDFFDAYVCAAAAGAARTARQGMITTAVRWTAVVDGMVTSTPLTWDWGPPGGPNTTYNVGLPYDPTTANCELTTHPICPTPYGENPCQ